MQRKLLPGFAMLWIKLFASRKDWPIRGSRCSTVFPLHFKMANMIAALAMMVHLVFSQDGPDRSDSCLLDSSCSDAASALQVSSLQNPPECDWVLGTLGQSCEEACEPDKVCSPAKQQALQGLAFKAVLDSFGAGLNCTDGPTTTADDRAPYIDKFGICKTCDNESSSQCEGPRPPDGDERRFCCCVEQGVVDNDPHIHTLRGAHYTLLQSGNFLAWSFSKAPVDWRLLAAYSGVESRFTTQSLLLLEKQSGLTLQMTAEDCGWQMKTENGWREVQPQLLSHGAANLEVQEARKHTQDPLMLESVLVLQMQQPGVGSVNVARLLTHCGPKKHLNFKVKMYATKDLNYVGGELGGAPRSPHNQHHLSFLSAKLNSMIMQKDTEFQVLGTWDSLGGSEAAEEFLKSKQQLGTALLSTETCTEAAEQEAETICAKHLPQDDHHAEVFIDCIYDVCHGGGEADALSAAAFISA